MAWTAKKSYGYGLGACGDMGARRVLEAVVGLEGFTAGKRQVNASKKLLMWPGRPRKAMDMALVPGRAGTWVPKKGFGCFWRVWRVSRLANGRLERQ